MDLQDISLLVFCITFSSFGISGIFIFLFLLTPLCKKKAGNNSLMLVAFFWTTCFLFYIPEFIYNARFYLTHRKWTCRVLFSRYLYYFLKFWLSGIFVFLFLLTQLCKKKLATKRSCSPPFFLQTTFYFVDARIISTSQNLSNS